jgi:hypothetical protein
MKNLLFTLVLLVSFSSFGQDYRNSKDALKLCSVLQSNNFVSDSQTVHHNQKHTNFITN